MANDIGGVWRTIGGRRVFIKDGQSVFKAMQESGKYKHLENDLKLNDKDYFYHYTKKENIDEIKKEGLIPKTDIGFYEYALFLGEYSNIEELKNYGDIALRIPKKYISNPQKYLGDLYIKKQIEPENIQIFRNRKWEYLKKKRR